MSRVIKSQNELDQLVLDTFAIENSANILDELRPVLSILNLLDVRSMIEIGSENGGSIIIWLKLWEHLRLFAVDADLYGLPTSREERSQRWNYWCSGQQSVDVSWGSSHDPEILALTKKNMQHRGIEQIDLLYIDGDHTEVGIEQDFAMYSPLVRPGGLVLFTDIHKYPGREDSEQGYLFWDKFKPKPISQWESREPHPRPNWHVFDYYHDFGKQSSFGFGLWFKPEEKKK